MIGTVTSAGGIARVAAVSSSAACRITGAATCSASAASRGSEFGCRSSSRWSLSELSGPVCALGLMRERSTSSGSVSGHMPEPRQPVGGWGGGSVGLRGEVISVHRARSRASRSAAYAGRCSAGSSASSGKSSSDGGITTFGSPGSSAFSQRSGSHSCGFATASSRRSTKIFPAGP